jgi:hypothetical protein
MDQPANKDDISIGKGRWITFGDLSEEGEVIEIDRRLAPIMPLLDKLETRCRADCCGIQAFGLWPEDIKQAIATFGPAEREELAYYLACVQSEIEQLRCDTVNSSRMNQFFLKPVFVEVLAHIRSVVEGGLRLSTGLY